MNTCKECKHWFARGWTREWDIAGGKSVDRQITEKDDPECKTGHCLHRKVVSDYVDGWVGRSEPGDVPTDGVYATCDENRGILEIGPDFGCIHFEKQ